MKLLIIRKNLTDEIIIENTEGELKQVSGCNGVNYNDESVVGVENGTNNKVSDDFKATDNYNGQTITNNNDDSLSANKVVIKKVSRGENNGDII